jgi:hypothetical protein
MKNIPLNQQLRDWSAAASRFWAEVPYVLLIQRFMTVRLLLLVGALVIALWVLVALLFVKPALTAAPGGARPLVLETDIIDGLEVWLEERQGERERTIVGGSRDYFAP